MKILFLYYTQFRNFKLTQFIEDKISVNMTIAARLPNDLE